MSFKLEINMCKKCFKRNIRLLITVMLDYTYVHIKVNAYRLWKKPFMSKYVPKLFFSVHKAKPNKLKINLMVIDQLKLMVIAKQKET